MTRVCVKNYTSPLPRRGCELCADKCRARAWASGCCTSVLVSTHPSVAICRQCYVTNSKRTDLFEEIPRDTHASSRLNARDVTSAAGPTITCTQSEDATVTPRSPNDRMAVASTTEVASTPNRKRLAATSTLRTFPRPPNAFRRSFILVASGSDETVATLERSTSLISPATWSALAPITTCSAVADGRTKPRAPSALSAAVLTASWLTITRRKRVVQASTDVRLAGPPTAAL